MSMITAALASVSPCLHQDVPSHAFKSENTHCCQNGILVWIYKFRSYFYKAFSLAITKAIVRGLKVLQNSGRNYQNIGIKAKIDGQLLAIL